MSYDLEFHPDALKEWRALDNSVREQMKKKLVERLQEPHVVPLKLSGYPQRYKIKLRSAGFRLVYEVQDSRLVVLVVAVDSCHRYRGRYRDRYRRFDTDTDTDTDTDFEVPRWS